jgi:hypothetical protein
MIPALLPCSTVQHCVAVHTTAVRRQLVQVSLCKAGGNGVLLLSMLVLVLICAAAAAAAACFYCCCSGAAALGLLLLLLAYCIPPPLQLAALLHDLAWEGHSS